LEYSTHLTKIEGDMTALCTGSLLYRFILQHSAVLNAITVWNKTGFIFLQRNIEMKDTAECLKSISISQGHVNVQNTVPEFTAPAGNHSLVHLV
jgi:hypothetical protein